MKISDLAYPPAELRAIAVRLLRLADSAELATQERASNQTAKADEAVSDYQNEQDCYYLAAIAQNEYQARARREQHFSMKLFGEPAWDMLLDLYLHKVRGQRVRTTSLCIAANVPPTTALRWIDVLEKEGLIERSDCEEDNRVTFVELSQQGFKQVSRYLKYRSRTLDKFLAPTPVQRALEATEKEN